MLSADVTDKNPPTGALDAHVLYYFGAALSSNSQVFGVK